jgi:hypothetical protein
MGGCVVGTTQDHRKRAEECVAKAQLSDQESDKVLWLTLAQSWVRLGEHVAQAGAYSAESLHEEEPFLKVPSD